MSTADELARYFASSVKADRWNEGAPPVGMIKLPASDLIRSLTRLVEQARREGAEAMREQCVKHVHTDYEQHCVCGGHDRIAEDLRALPLTDESPPPPPG